MNNINKIDIDAYVKSLMEDEDYIDFTIEEIREMIIDMQDDIAEIEGL